MMVEVYDVQFSRQDMLIVIKGLSELPYKISSPVLKRLLEQTDAQEAAANTVPEQTDGGE